MTTTTRTSPDPPTRAAASFRPVWEWARRVHLRTREHRSAFARLEAAQRRFVSVEESVGGPSYAWPAEPLYEWSRRVEYPFVVQALAAAGGRPLRLLDAGSGVTFFDVFLSHEPGLRVECVDRDPTYPDRMARTCRLLATSPPAFHVGDLTGRLPFEDRSFDVALCVSVLEHLPEGTLLPALRELWRLVAPGGALIFTMDVTLAGAGEGLPLEGVPEFAAELSRVVGSLHPLPAKMPVDLLTPQRPGYALAPQRLGGRVVRPGPRAWWLDWKQVPLPRFDPLACLLCVAPKPGR
jgi:SAM-dependent methyltransferase